MSDNKKDDYGYFGTGIDGYVHYKQAFDQSFHEDNGVTNEPAKQAPLKAHGTTRQGNQQEERTTCPIHTIFTRKRGFIFTMDKLYSKNNKPSCRQRANV